MKNRKIPPEMCMTLKEGFWIHRNYLPRVERGGGTMELMEKFWRFMMSWYYCFPVECQKCLYLLFLYSYFFIEEVFVFFVISWFRSAIWACILSWFVDPSLYFFSSFLALMSVHCRFFTDIPSMSHTTPSLLLTSWHMDVARRNYW